MRSIRGYGLRAVGVICLASACHSELLAREWKSKDGKFKVEAEFVAVKGENVVLETTDGEFLKVPLTKFCDEDVAFVKSQGKPDEGKSKKKKPSAPPKPDLDEPESDPFVSDEDIADEAGDESSEGMDDDEAQDEADGADAPSLKAKPGERKNVPVVKIKGEKPGSAPGLSRTIAVKDLRAESLAFSPDGRILAVGGSSGKFELFDVSSGDRLDTQERKGVYHSVEAIAFAASGKRLIAGVGEAAAVFDLTNERRLREGKRFVGHSRDIKSIAISPDGKFALTGDDDKRARYWDVAQAREVRLIGDFEGEIKLCAITPDGRHGYASDGETLASIDFRTGKIRRLRIADSYTSSRFLAMAPDCKKLAMGTYRGLRVIWTRDASEAFTLGDSNPIGISDAEVGVFTLDGGRLLTGGSRKVAIWSTKSHRQLHAQDVPDALSVKHIAASPDNVHYATGDLLGQSVTIFRAPLK